MKEDNTILESFKMTELGLLPEEWEVVKLGDFLDVLRNGTTKKQNKDGKGYPVSRIETISTGVVDPSKVGFVENLTDEQIVNYQLKEGDILFSHINSEPYLGNSAIYKNNLPVLIHGMNLLMLRTKIALLDSEFLNYLFNSYRSKGIFIGIASRAVNQSSINQGRLKSLLIPLLPLLIQQKIAAVLSTVQEAKEKAEVVIKAAKELKKSLRKHLFTYGPVSLEDAKEVKLKDTETGRIRDEWEIIPANKVFRQITDGTHDTPKKLSGGFPLIKSKQIKNGRVDVSNADYFISEEDYQYVNKRSKVDKCDILFSMIGTVGEVALIEDEPTFAIKNVGLFKSNYDLDLTTYCYHWLQSEKAKEHTSKNLSGTSQKYITLAKLRDFPILFPDKSMREKISSILSSVDKKIEAEENKRKTLEELFKTLLNNLMTARIRVNHLEIAV